jgi:hypothetical protein
MMHEKSAERPWLAMARSKERDMPAGSLKEWNSLLESKTSGWILALDNEVTD